MLVHVCRRGRGPKMIMINSRSFAIEILLMHDWQ